MDNHKYSKAGRKKPSGRQATTRADVAASGSRAKPSTQEVVYASKADLHEHKPVTACLYCGSAAITKKGKRTNKHGSMQLYFCTFCQKKFTPLSTKHRTYPIRVIIDVISRYNRLYSIDEARDAVENKFGIKIAHRSAQRFIHDFKDALPYLRLRKQALTLQRDVRPNILERRLFHGQVYDFKYHRVKARILYEQNPEQKHLIQLMTYLDNVPRTCPHELFRAQNRRASQTKQKFNLDAVEITPIASNIAIDSARFALQAVSNNKLRHETLQEFMLINDSATIAVEVPIVLRQQDINYYHKTFDAQIPIELDDEPITGHIDIVQVRNGMIHIVDYKPGAKKEKPFEQLMVYALALSRRTKLPLYYFKCAWFDDQNYYEFYPLRVVKKR